MQEELRLEPVGVPDPVHRTRFLLVLPALLAFGIAGGAADVATSSLCFRAAAPDAVLKAGAVVIAIAAMFDGIALLAEMLRRRPPRLALVLFALVLTLVAIWLGLATVTCLHATS